MAMLTRAAKRSAENASMSRRKVPPLKLPRFNEPSTSSSVVGNNNFTISESPTGSSAANKRHQAVNELPTSNIVDNGPPNCLSPDQSPQFHSESPPAFPSSPSSPSTSDNGDNTESAEPATTTTLPLQSSSQNQGSDQSQLSQPWGLVVYPQSRPSSNEATNTVPSSTQLSAATSNRSITLVTGLQKTSEPVNTSAALKLAVSEDQKANKKLVPIGDTHVTTREQFARTHNNSANNGFCVYDRITQDVKLCKKLTTEKHQTVLDVHRRLIEPFDLGNIDEVQLANMTDRSRQEEDVLLDITEAIFPSKTELFLDKKLDSWFMVTPKHYGDLHAYVREHEYLQPEEAQKLFRQIVRIISLCHCRGLVLRDLKLRKFVFVDQTKTQLRLESVEDIHVCPDENIFEDTLTDRHGCPAYVSPEILIPGPPKYGGRAADVWGLGILLYVMLLGRYPFFDQTPVGLFAKIRIGMYCFQGVKDSLKLNKTVQTAIRCLLRPNPLERPTAVDLLAMPWVKTEPKPPMVNLMKRSSNEFEFFRRRAPAGKREIATQTDISRLNE